jgi:hypothetical protein
VSDVYLVVNGHIPRLGLSLSVSQDVTSVLWKQRDVHITTETFGARCCALGSER